MYSKSDTATAVATGMMVSSPCSVTALGITGGADAATAVFRDGGPTGVIRWKLGAAIGISEGISFCSGIRFRRGVHLTITGTTPVVTAAFESSQANQDNPS